MVGQDLLSVENGGVEISEAGFPGSAAGLTFAGGPTGNFYPQVSASTAEPKWMLTTANNFTKVVAQFAVAPQPDRRHRPQPRSSPRWCRTQRR